MMEWWLAEGLGGQGELLWTAEPWAIGLASVLALFSVFLVRRRTGPRRGWELICWIAAVSILVWGVSEPHWVTESGRTEPGRSVILVDESRSMSVTENGVERGSRAMEILNRMDSNADVYSFSSAVRAGKPLPKVHRTPTQIRA